MRKSLFIAAVSIATVALSACTPGHNVPGSTLAGATAGGLIGGGLFHGSPYGVIGGALLGGIIGNQIGQYMDRQDRANMHSAVVYTPVGSAAHWTNHKTNVTYQVQPIKNYHKGNRYCREYQERVKINGKWQQAYGHACRMPDGSWHITK